MSLQNSFRSRRSFLQSTAVLGAGMYAGFGGPVQSHGADIAGQYDGLDSDDFLGEVHIETEIRDESVFTEGPAVDRNGIVFFTNVPMSKILRWDPETKDLSIFRTDSNNANGLLFEPDGSLLACEGGMGRVTRTDMDTGRITIVADQFNGFPLADPNDIARDSKGRLYFSSRPGTNDPAEGNPNAVYRVDPDGTVHQLLHTLRENPQGTGFPATHMPNGIVVSPDEETLYLIEAHSGAGFRRNIMAYRLSPTGELSEPREHAGFYPGRSGDGMCIDAEGNLYVAAGLHSRRGTSETLDTRPGIHVISPQGRLLAYRETPVDTITNCSFGGEDLKTLYVTCGKYLLSIPTSIPGKSDYRPKA